MNIFTLSFDQRLQDWYYLRQSLQDSDLETVCIEVDKFWQQCPLNTYTLSLLGIKDVDLLSAKDYNDIDVVLATVDNAKYVMNYWPDSVVNTKLSEFTDIKYINIDILKHKIGQE